METLTIGELKVTWLRGGNNHLDGGAMFGVVPKELWTKKYPISEGNRIPMRTDPLLVQTEKHLMLIDAGIGKGMLDEKKKRHFGVTEESFIAEDLQKLGFTCEDITHIIMTHLHFDHVSGLTKCINGNFSSAFPNARIFVSDIEWNEMRNPNIRSKNTYWKQNWEFIQHQIITFSDKDEIVPGVTVHHTGGHSDGHAVVVLKGNNDILVHMGDLLPTHAHQNVLWVMAYDDYPMTSIEQKQQWLAYAYEHQAWLSFYHDAFYRAVKWDNKGEIVDEIKRVHSTSIQ
ncbi:MULTISPECIES: YtnP family quorum-quenching lactonase [Priestia]|uniref:YtnP family quorum-quenching lactonase n=1 Tax=Priestia TaxID=2800373 RepID=UPI00287750C4|nr:MBL fold metallo-hydrolase [Priestia megaterium]MBX4161503.1 MBL fold metallo-hydrolase [Priestia megaterium]